MESAMDILRLFSFSEQDELVKDIEEDIKENKKTKDKAEKLKIRNYLTWTANELMLCLYQGYECVGTVIEKDFSCRVIIDNPEDILGLSNKYKLYFRPRYIHYYEKVFIHIENYLGIYKEDDKLLARRLTPMAAHMWLASKHRLSNDMLRNLLYFDSKYSKLSKEEKLKLKDWKYKKPIDKNKKATVSKPGRSIIGSKYHI